MSYRQQGDVILYQSLNDGEIEIVDGIVTMDGGLQTAVYLSLFGGNIDDAAGFDKRLSWWGNAEEPDEAKKIRSLTQYNLKGLPATSANLLIIKDSVLSDLSWITEVGAATEVNCEVSIPGLNKVKINVNIIAEGASETFEFFENWRQGL